MAFGRISCLPEGGSSDDKRIRDHRSDHDFGRDRSCPQILAGRVLHSVLHLDPVHEGEVALEVTFSPENVFIGEIETDVLVSWGTADEVSGWLEQLLSEIPVELCPLADEPRLRDVLFSENSREIERVDSAKPWMIR